MRAIIALLVVGSMLVAGCSPHDDSRHALDLDTSTAVELQARAFQRACQDVICAGAPVYAPDSTPETVREAIVTRVTDEVQYLGESEIEQRTSPQGRFSDGATLISVGSVQSTGRAYVKSVDVGVSKGFNDSNGRTYLFLWNGDQRVDTTPDAVGVTVTSSVSQTCEYRQPEGSAHPQRRTRAAR